jgi:signal transduction histidine kinase
MLNVDGMLAHLDKIKMSKMLFWEGTTFIVLLILISTSLLIFYLKDQKKTKALHDFFASLTHELKTPLASIKLQGEVIGELLENKNDTHLKKLLERLTSDTIKLETQMDKLLQLSRIERGGELNLTPVKLVPFINNCFKYWSKDLELDLISENKDLEIMADEFALELIFKNLFENTKNHGASKKITLKIIDESHKVKVSYTDNSEYNGDRRKLSELFYKHNSSKGSGIGLYLTKKLSEKMNSDFFIGFDPVLSFHFTFNKSEDRHA